MTDVITIDQFSKIDLRVGQIAACERIDGTDKLLKLQISLGAENRQIVAGMAAHYEPEVMVGKQVIVVCNLRPAVIRGVESQGMLLVAKDGEKFVLLGPEQRVGNGSKVS